jgi:type II secretory pathway component PulK
LDLIDPICDWLDSNSEAGPTGAEDTYYAELSPPYPCKDGPLASLEELFLVKGMTEEILYGTAEKKGLIHYLTIYSDGPININTAGAEVLQSLSEGIEEDMAQAIVDYLREEPYKREGGLSLCDHIKHLVMEVAICEELQGQSGVKSSIFSVRVEGQVRGIKKRIVTVLNRGGKEITPVFWRVE